MKFSLAELGGSQAEKQEGSICVNALNRLYFATTADLVFSWRVLLWGEALPVGQITQLDPDLWHPGGSVIVAPQVRAESLGKPLQSSETNLVKLASWL